MRNRDFYLVIFQPGAGGHIIASLISNVLRNTPIFITPIHANCHNFEAASLGNFSFTQFTNYLKAYKKIKHDVLIGCGHPGELNSYNEEFITSLQQYNKINLIFIDTHNSIENQIQAFVNLYIKYDFKLFIKSKKNSREIIHTYKDYEKYIESIITQNKHPIFSDIKYFIDTRIIVKQDVYESMLNNSNHKVAPDIAYQVTATNKIKSNFNLIQNDVDTIYQKATLSVKDKINVYNINFRSLCNNRSDVLNSITNITKQKPTDYTVTLFEYWHQLTKMLYTLYIPYLDYESGKIKSANEKD